MNLSHYYKEKKIPKFFGSSLSNEYTNEYFLVPLVLYDRKLNTFGSLTVLGDSDWHFSPFYNFKTNWQIEEIIDRLTDSENNRQLQR